MSNNLSIQKHRVKITVMKKHFHEELVRDYAANPENWTACTHFEIGDEFITCCTDGYRPVVFKLEKL